jgi:HSP20 family protein
MNTTLTKDENRAKVGNLRRDGGYVTPQVNIVETGEEYLLEAEMPGVSKDRLEVLLEGNELSIIGRRQFEEPGNVELIYRESTLHDYRRTFVLDPVIDTARIRAEMEQGVLRLHLPKAEKVKPRRITVSD